VELVQALESRSGNWAALRSFEGSPIAGTKLGTRNPPSSRNKIFARLAGDFLISFLEEFMARSSNKAVQISRFFMLCSRLFLVWTTQISRLVR
jgi:hypothetical protein